MYTFGHSSRSTEEFVSALQSYGVTVVVDVRRYPGSRRNPQFGADELASSLDEHELTRFAEVDDGRVTYPADDS